jgi:hypothetical protein
MIDHSIQSSCIVNFPIGDSDLAPGFAGRISGIGTEPLLDSHPVTDHDLILDQNVLTEVAVTSNDR